MTPTLSPHTRRGLRVVAYLAAGAALGILGGNLAALAHLPALAPYLDNPATMSVLAGLIAAGDKAIRDREGAAGLDPALGDQLAQLAAAAVTAALAAQAPAQSQAPAPSDPAPATTPAQ